MNHITAAPERSFPVNANSLPFYPDNLSVSTKHSNISTARDETWSYYTNLDVCVNAVIVNVYCAPCSTIQDGFSEPCARLDCRWTIFLFANSRGILLCIRYSISSNAWYYDSGDHTHGQNNSLLFKVQILSPPKFVGTHIQLNYSKVVNNYSGLLKLFFYI